MRPIQPDAHLRTALRHAPDADVQAPADVSAQILAAAHRAADVPPARAATPVRSWWPWRHTWRMGASGAFASVLMAGVIGLLWQGEPPVPTSEEAAPAAVAPAVAVAPAAPAPDHPAAQKATPQVASARVASESPPARSARLPMPAAAAPPPAAAMGAVAAPGPPPAIDLAQADASLQRARRVMDTAPAPVLASAPAPALEAARAAAGPAASLSLSGSRAAVGSANIPGAVSGMSTALAPAAKARPALPSSLPWPGALTEGSSLTLLLPGLARTADPALLQAVLRLTAGRWTADTGAQPQAGETPLEWRQGDQVLGRLWLGEQRALLCPAQGVQAPCQVAPLTLQAAAELKEKLPR